MADMAHGEVRLEAVELGRRNVYNGPMIFDLVITFLIVRSFTDKPKESNFIEDQLSGKATNRKKTLNNVGSQ
jgi:hypothetical protein